MREIKFRAWDNHGTMCDVFGVDIYSIYIDEGEPENGIYGVEPTITRDARSAWELMQYTGLKDKNGVEIYEGDICDKNFSNGQVGVVTYKGAMYCLEVHFCGLVQDHNLTINTEDVEVIGNIYENPELLEAK